MNLVEVLVCVLNDRKLKGRLRGVLNGRTGKFRETMIGKHLITGEPAEQNDFDRIIVQFQSNLYKNYTNEQSIETLCRQFIGVLKEFGKNSSDAAVALEESWRDSVAKEIPKIKWFLCADCSEISLATGPNPLAGKRPGLQHHHDDGQYGNGNPDCHSFVKVNGDASVSGSTSVTNNPSSDVFLTEGLVTSDSLPPGTKRLVPNTGFSPNLSPNRLPIEETLQNGPTTMKPLMSPPQHNHSPPDRSVSEPQHASNNAGREKDQTRRSLSHEGGSQRKSRNKKRGKSRQDSERNDSRRNSRVETLERDLLQAEQQVQSLRQITESQSSTISSLTQQLNQEKQSNINAPANNYNGHDKTYKKGTVQKKRKGSGSQHSNTSQPLQQSNTSRSSIDSNKSRRWTSIHLLLTVLVVIGFMVVIAVLYIAYKLYRFEIMPFFSDL